MKSKWKYLVSATLLFGLSGFNSAKAANTVEISSAEVFVELQQFVERVNQSFTQVEQALSELEARLSENQARTTALETEPKATIASTAPTVFDDINAGFTAGSVWIDTTRVQASILVHGAPGAAVWKPITDQTFYEVGEKGPAGGIVFYVTAGGMHGLEAAPEDQGTAPWGCVDRVLDGADGVAIGTGAQNTAAILAGCPYTGIAARVVNDYSLNGYSDWFLPSKDELIEMLVNRESIGGFADFSYYWSSSDASDLLLPGKAWGLIFTNVEVDISPRDIPRSLEARVRAIRAF